jgi:hypothetical protein
VAAVHGDRVRLGISAPLTVRVDRQEVHELRAFSRCLQTPGVTEVRPYKEV